MKQVQGLTGIILGGTAIAAAIQPAIASPVELTSVQLNPTASGVDIVLKTNGESAPQVYAVNRGNSWTADVTNTQLAVPGGSFSKANPAPGISLVTVAPIDNNSVRVTVTGKSSTPIGKIGAAPDGGVLFSLSPLSSKQPALRSNSPLPPLPSTLKARPVAQPIAVSPVGVPGAIAQATVPTTPTTKTTPTPVKTTPPPSGVAPLPTNSTPMPPLPTAPGSTLVPNPEVTITGGNQGAKPGVPPMLPRAVAPPVGDISVSQVNASPAPIDLGTRERIPRLVLRDAPVREVLALLARAAGLNLAYISPPVPAGGQASGATSPEPTITLDVENEAVQDVFNYVLRVACVPVAAGGGQTGAPKCSPLDANIVGRTLFVGPRLPNSARNLVVRTLRMNQVPVDRALLYLVGLGAETAVARERQVTSVSAIPVATTGGLTGGAQQTNTSLAGTQSLTTTETRLEVQRVDYQDSVPVLRGLQVSGDERTNQLTLVGTPQQVEVAVASLTQLDVRRRQVAVNVKVIDINLLALDRFSSSFSFGVNDTRVVNDGGVGVINFGRNAPATLNPNSGATNTNIGGSSIGQAFSAATQAFKFANQFFLQLQAAVTNGNAKILTDPTLIVQEGQTATVNLTQEVITNFVQNITNAGGAGGLAQVTTTVEKARAGLILPVKIDRIDDNGFVSLSVAPSISSPDQSVPINVNGSVNNITLLQERRVESGQIRLRDGQTLVLSGIIQDSDRVSVTKVPILGDIPLLGALFRRNERQNQRREVIVLVTPRVIEDTQTSTFGYTFNPSPAARQMMERSSQPVKP